MLALTAMMFQTELFLASASMPLYVVAESVNALKDRKIEAFFWVGGLPTAAVTDLASTPNTKIKVIDIAQYTAKMNAKYGPLYAEATIPATMYKGMEADAKNNSVWNIMAVNASMDEKLAYDLTRIMLEKRTDLALVQRKPTTSSSSGRPPTAPAFPGIRVR